MSPQLRQAHEDKGSSAEILLASYSSIATHHINRHHTLTRKLLPGVPPSAGTPSVWPDHVSRKPLSLAVQSAAARGGGGEGGQEEGLDDGGGSSKADDHAAG